MLYNVFLCLGSLFRNREVIIFFQFLMLFIVFLCLGSLFRNREVFSFFFQILMLFIVLLCLASLFRNREEIFTPKSCHISHLSPMVGSLMKLLE